MLFVRFIVPPDRVTRACVWSCARSGLRAHLALHLAAWMEPRQCSGLAQVRLNRPSGSTRFQAQIPRPEQHCIERGPTTCTRAGKCASDRWLLVWPLPWRFEYLPAFHGGPGARHWPCFGANPSVAWTTDKTLPLLASFVSRPRRALARVSGMPLSTNCWRKLSLSLAAMAAGLMPSEISAGNCASRSSS